MKVNTKEFLNILRLLKPGVAHKEIINQAQHFLFTENTISSYNDKIFISHYFEHPFNCSVKAEDLYNLISSITNEEIELEMKDNQFLVTSKNTKSGFASFSEGDLFEIINKLNNDYSTLDWKSLPEDFIQGLSICMFSVSKDSMKGVLSGISVNKEGIISSDDYRITKYQLNETINDSFILPLSSAIELINFSITKYAITESWAHFLTDTKVRFSVRLLTGDYPDVSEYLSMNEKPKTELKFPEKTNELIRHLSTMTEGDTVIEKKLQVVLENKTATFGVEKKGLFWAKKDIPIDYFDEKLTFLVNPVFFYQVLEKDVIMKVYENQATFEADNFFHLFSLPVGE